jgi:hypothetical protein
VAALKLFDGGDAGVGDVHRDLIQRVIGAVKGLQAQLVRRLRGHVDGIHIRDGDDAGVRVHFEGTFLDAFFEEAELAAFKELLRWR